MINYLVKNKEYWSFHSIVVVLNCRLKREELERRLAEGVTRRRKLREMFEDLKKSRIYAAEEAARKLEADEIYRLNY